MIVKQTDLEECLHGMKEVRGSSPLCSILRLYTVMYRRYKVGRQSELYPFHLIAFQIVHLSFSIILSLSDIVMSKILTPKAVVK